jgi:hypothetical protein
MGWAWPSQLGQPQPGLVGLTGDPIDHTLFFFFWGGPGPAFWARSSPGLHGCWRSPAIMQLSGYCMKNHA